MRAPQLAALVAATIVLPAIHASAEDINAPSPPPVYGYVEVMNNYVSRGLSQSVGRPSAHAEIDLNAGPGLYGAAAVARIDWVDAVYPGAHVPAELAGVIGYRALIEPGFIIEAGVLRVQYPGSYPHASTLPRPDTTELFGHVRWRWLGAKFNRATTDAFGTPNSRGSWYLDMSAAVPLSPDVLLGAHVGRSHASGSDPFSGKPYSSEFSYTDYKVSATRYFGGGLSLALAYAWSTAPAGTYTLNGYNTGGHQFFAALEQDF
ncbi:MAG TPA: TorF family putative porin [Rudaea sp.]|nr:TorF family putative porin [Rudaea sp.]